MESAHLQAVAALEELRKSVRVLSGEEELSDLGANLAGAINATMAGTDIVVRSDIDDLDLGSERNRFLYSSLKEGLNNGIRHGKATAFYFSLKGEADGAHFLLSDNGSGGRGYHKGYGLSSMEKRRESWAERRNSTAAKGRDSRSASCSPSPIIRRKQHD